jgi:TonB-linked SusC/RagA family outer membrane protein
LGIDFVYSEDLIPSGQHVNASLKDVGLREALQKLLKDLPIRFDVVDNTVVLSPQPIATAKPSTTPTVQNIVSGTVSVHNGRSTVPQGGATVSVKGRSSSTTQSGDDGSYRITVQAGEILLFSFLGYEDQEVSVSTSNVINIILEPKEALVEEVIVTGYQNVDRKFFTGASTNVKAKDAERVGVPDISRMLEGQAAGVSVQNVSGTFGAAPKIRVRGATSITGDNKPLWVVDGIILEDVVNISNEQLSTGDPNTLIGSSVAGLNPDDIESFNILKDAAATAMYGARAMNGVIVVTTKKGKATEGAPIVSYTGNFTSYLKPNYNQYNVMNSADQMDLYLELSDKGYIAPARTGTASSTGVFGKMYNMMYQWDPTTGEYALANTVEAKEKYLREAALRNTDWFDILFKNSLLQEHSISVSGGSSKARFYASTSLMDDKGWTIADNVKRMTGNLRGDFNITDKIQLGLLSNFSVRDQYSPGGGSRQSNVVSGEYYRDFDTNPFIYSLNTSRALAAYEDDGSYAFYTKNYAPFSILHELENNILGTTGLDIKMQAELSYRIIPKLKYSLDGAYRYARTKQEHNVYETANAAETYRIGTQYGIGGENSVIAEANRFLYTDPDNPTAKPVSVLPYGGFHRITENDLKNYYLRNMLNFTDKIDRHSYDILGVAEYRHVDRQNSFFDGVGYQFDKGGIPYFSPVYFEYISKGNVDYYGMGKGFDRYVAFMSRAAYSYDDRYNLNFTYRYDGSNKLGKSKVARWLPTWNISGAWNLDNEKFFEKQSLLSQTRVRATYGLVASLGAATNSSVVYYNAVTDRPRFGDRENALDIADLENSELTWEKQYETNIGTDLGFLDNRLNVTADFYWRQGFDLIGTFRTAGLGGQYSKRANYGDMKSKGQELTVQYKVLDNEKWKWNVRVNAAHHKSEITLLQNAPRIWDVVKEEGGAKVGYPVRGLFSIKFDGLRAEDGLPLFTDENGIPNQTAVYMQSTDLSNLTYHGPIDAILTGGLYNSISYKNLTFSSLFTFSGGNVVRLAPVFSPSYSDQDASSNDLLSRWVIIGDHAYTNAPAILGRESSNTYEGYPYHNYNYSDARVANGDFIKLKQFIVSYGLPAQALKSIKARAASLSLVGNNLWLIHSDKKLMGQDPEFYQSGGVALPVQRQFSMSLKLTY